MLQAGPFSLFEYGQQVVHTAIERDNNLYWSIAYSLIISIIRIPKQAQGKEEIIQRLRQRIDEIPKDFEIPPNFHQDFLAGQALFTEICSQDQDFNTLKQYVDSLSNQEQVQLAILFRMVAAMATRGKQICPTIKNEGTIQLVNLSQLLELLQQYIPVIIVQIYTTPTVTYEKYNHKAQDNYQPVIAIHCNNQGFYYSLIHRTVYEDQFTGSSVGDYFPLIAQYNQLMQYYDNFKEQYAQADLQGSRIPNQQYESQPQQPSSTQWNQTEQSILRYSALLLQQGVSFEQIQLALQELNIQNVDIQKILEQTYMVYQRKEDAQICQRHNLFYKMELIQCKLKHCPGCLYEQVGASVQGDFNLNTIKNCQPQCYHRQVVTPRDFVQCDLILRHQV